MAIDFSLAAFGIVDEDVMEDLRINTINRTEKVKIFVNGKEVVAYRGETVLSALLASGYRVLRKSRSGETRCALCGMGVCFECLVSVNGCGGQRSCMVEVEENMEISIDE
jgi:sarcosine oxidase subunit alpha